MSMSASIKGRTWIDGRGPLPYLPSRLGSRARVGSRIRCRGFERYKMHRTLDEIRREGLDALRARLGRAGMIRFLQQFEAGEGDYASQRRAWADTVSLDDLKKQVRRGQRHKRTRRSC